MPTAVEKMRGALDRPMAWACWPAVALLNLVLQPDPNDGSVRGWKLALWMAANVALLAAMMVLMQGGVLLIALAAFLLLHVLIVLSSLRIMSQEKRVMEGTLPREQMTLSARDAVNNVSILTFSTLFYVCGLAAFINLLEDSGLATILKRKPALAIEYAQYLACVLNEVPLVGTLLHVWANMTGVSDNLNADIVYSGWQGNGVKVLIVLTVSVIAVRALVLRLQQVSHQIAMTAALEHKDIDVETLHRRFVRVPSHMRDRLAHMAAFHPNLAARERASRAIAKLKVAVSPLTYLHAMHTLVALPEAELKALKETLATMPASVKRALTSEAASKFDHQMRARAGSLGKEANALIDDIKGLLARK